MFKLLRHFSLCSAVVMALMTATLVWAYRATELKNLVHIAESENVSLARTIANTTGDSIRNYVEFVAQVETEKLKRLPETEYWHSSLKRITHGLPVLKIKFYTGKGRTVYSSEIEQIGKIPSSEEQFTAAVQSAKTSSQFEFRTRFVAFDAVLDNRHIVSSYVPILDETGKVGAVLEIYTDVTDFVTSITSHIWAVVAALAAAFGLLYLALFLIVRHADAVLERQYEDLSSFNATLEERVVERTRSAEAAATRATEANARLQGEIEERARAQDELAKANSSLAAATQAKSQFLANMSHEIRTPMNGVFGMTDLLLRTDLTDHQHRLASTISQSARNLLTVINDILDLSRIEAGKLEIDREEFDLAHCMEGAIDLLNESAARKRLNLSLFISREVPVMVWGDKGRLRQVCLNLIGNAIKFTAEGEVAVRVVAEAGDAGGTVRRVRFEVRDTGIGIDPEIRDRLFKPFVQADASISRRFGGTGLGLSISNHIVTLMGGTIEVQSEVGDGSTLSFTLPLEIGDESKVPRLTNLDSLAGVRMLVIDDRETNREILCGYLSAAGAATVQAKDGTEGLRLLQRAQREDSPFAVALIDMLMPDINGLDLLKIITADTSLAALKSIIVTSLNRAGDQALVRACGGQTLLTKPVRERDLISSVLRALGKQPLSSMRSPVGAAQRRPAVQSTYAGTRVLLAEDNPVNIEVAKEYLALLGCRVTVAENGREAVSAQTAGRFDIILMDCQMPEMDGLTATMEIRRHEMQAGRDRTPIIAVTANAFEEDRLKCLAAGMDDYLSKPFTEQQLAVVFARWLSRPAEAPVETAGATAQQTVEPPSDAPAPTRAAVQAPPTATATLQSGPVAKRPSLRTRLIQAYRQYAPPAVAKLRAALDGADAVALKLTAHGLKSSSANVAATDLADLYRRIEAAAGAGDVAACLPLVTQAEREFKALLAAFETEIAGPDAARTAAAAG